MGQNLPSNLKFLRDLKDDSIVLQKSDCHMLFIDDIGDSKWIDNDNMINSLSFDMPWKVYTSNEDDVETFNEFVNARAWIA